MAAAGPPPLGIRGIAERWLFDLCDRNGYRELQCVLPMFIILSWATDMRSSHEAAHPSMDTW